MKLLLRRVGIPCDVVTGGDHAWNIVNIEGENYYVDTTWDDPVPDIKGYISRTHFNVTEEQLAASGHEWVASDYPSCDSTKYAFYKILMNGFIRMVFGIILPVIIVKKWGTM